MPTYTATAPDGRKVSATGPTPPTEKEWDDIFAAVKAPPSAPFDVQASREKLAAANKAYDENAALNANQNKSILGHIGDQFTPGKILERGGQGALGAGEGLVGGAVGTVAGAAALPIYALDKASHPLQTIEQAKEAVKLGTAMAVAAGQDPVGASNAAWDAFARVASDPRNVGRAVGAYYGGKAVIESPLAQKSWEATKGIAGKAANKLIPGLADWREERAAAQAAEAAAAARNAPGPVVPSTVGPMRGGYATPATDANIPDALAAPKVTQPMPASAPPLGTTPPPAPSPPPPGPAASTVQPPAVPQPPPATTPANTPPRAAAPPPSPAARSVAETIAGWTPEEYNSVKDLPVNQRIAYLRMRQGGYAVDDAMATVQQMQKAEQAQTLRAMKGSKKAAEALFGTTSQKAVQAVKELAPGPTRTPHDVVNAAMDNRFRELAGLKGTLAEWALGK